MSHFKISDEYLNSFVDNQLDSAEKIQAYESIRQDESFKDRVCELSGLKEMMQHAYKTPPSYNRQTMARRSRWSRQAQVLAACMLLLAGGLSGWVSHAWSISSSKNTTLPVISSNVSEEIRRVIVHLNNSSPASVLATLDETQGLLDSYRQANRKIQIEVITNKQGVNLLRSDLSSQSGRVTMMQDKYDNLQFLVCGQTIKKLEKKGETIKLIPHTGIATSAADQINKRIKQGWGYVRI